MPISEIESSLENLKAELGKLPPAASQLNHATQSLKDTSQSLAGLSTRLTTVSELIEKICVAIDRVDFPARLGSLDSSVVQIKQGQQAQQEGLKTLESQVMNSLVAEHKKILEILSKRHTEILGTVNIEVVKARRWNWFIGIMLILLAIASSAVYLLIHFKMI